MPLTVGAQAPDFTLPNQNREPVTMSQQWKQGPVVLAFFPAAFSSVCTTEMCAFQNDLSGLSAIKAQVFGISVDTFFALAAFAKDIKAAFPLLSDFNKEVIQAYDVLNPDMIGLKGIAKRSVFVIDRRGTVRYAEVLEDARNEPNYAAVRAAAEAAASA
jgi:peroxiredoxin